MNKDLTKGNIIKSLLFFSLPLMVGNILQQFYNIADTFIVGRYVGEKALAAVGSSYALMIFLISVILGLCMGSGVYISMQFGKRDLSKLRNGIFISFILIAAVCLVLNFLSYVFIDKIIELLKIPFDIRDMTRVYLLVIFSGILPTFLYNYFSNILRALGNALSPMIFLALAVVMNVFLDIVFVLAFKMGVFGAGLATVLSQYISAIAVIFYSLRVKEFIPKKRDCYFNLYTIKNIANLSLLTSLQQSIMNFGILTIQGLVNSFGSSVMAGFSTAVKIDTLAYSPMQDFGNAYSTFVAQNFGAKKEDRIKKGMAIAIAIIMIFCSIVGALVYLFAKPLMNIFVSNDATIAMKTGIEYLHIVSIFYFAIGILFMFYGYFRAINKSEISVVLTVVSLGLRVILAFILSRNTSIGIKGIWLAIPIGWIIADILAGYCYLKYRRKNAIRSESL